uniref:Major sperm protein n=1 Tax=Panagrolaimus superbus TaxID=310955 RepID=A0A914Y4M0_9BILA
MTENSLNDRLLLLTIDRKNVLDEIILAVNKSINRAKVYEQDLDRLNNEIWWPLAFFLAHKEDVHVTSAVIQECLRWRKCTNVYDLRLIEFVSSPEKLNIYLRGKDIYGNRILWIKLNQHDPSERTIDQLLIFWLEYNLKTFEMSPLTVVMDLSGAKNIDFTFLKFMVHCFKYFYPGCLAETLIYGNPTRMHASIRLFQTLLANYEFPMAHEITEKHQIHAFIRDSNLPESMNGTDRYTMDDLIKSSPANILPSGEHPSAVAETTNKPAELRPSIDDIISSKRFVRFEETEDPDEMAPNGHARSSSTARKQSTTAMLRLLVEEKQNAEPFEWFEADGIAINPKESLQLRQIDEERDPVDIFVIKNTGNNGLLFKIKTTSPEKFRVRPSVGFIPPQESDYVRIQLQNEYRPTLKAERFLFMGIRTNNENIENFGTLWKEVPASYKIEKTFNCHMASSDPLTLASAESFRQREPSIHSVNNEV